MITLIDAECTGLLPHMLREDGKVHCIMAAVLGDNGGNLEIEKLLEWYDPDFYDWSRGFDEEGGTDWEYSGGIQGFEFYPGEIIAGHNIIEYDIPVLENLGVEPPSSVLDSLVISRKNWPDRPGGHSIDAWAGRLDPPMQKPPISDWSQFNLQIRNRCREDVLIEVEVLKRVLDEMYKGVQKCA